VSSDDLSELANVFSFLIDFRSQFTATHSAGVAECAKALAELFGLTSTEVKSMEIAGQLHDLGKLSVPNTILEKSSGLTKEEFAIIKRHTYYTYTILKTIDGLGPIPEWAAFHHEKLDGTGYPFRVGEQDIDTGSRIMQVADLFTAMAESRPYRQIGMTKEQILKVFCDKVNDGVFDRRITGLLLNSYDIIRERVLARQDEVRVIYDSQFADEPAVAERLCA
jgi:HD-GYP domain-containing protein (c-di-GMP phosphodiesterase class II)